MPRAWRLTSILMVALLTFGTAILTGPAVPEVSAQQSGTLTPLGDGIYMYQHTGYTTVFVVTNEGVLLGDPMGVSRSTALRDAIRSVTSQPVRWVVYSHDHSDHASGGAVFRGTAQFYAHQNAIPRLEARRDPDVVMPDAALGDRAVFTPGGRRVELHWVGRNHSNSSLVLFMPRERLVWAVDFIPIQTLPFRDLGDAWIDEWIESISRVEQLDFTRIVPGHGDMGTREDVRAVREYLSELWTSVQWYSFIGFDDATAITAALRGRFRARYGSWAQFETFFPLNVQGMLRFLNDRNSGRIS
ncbi:MAG: MBL fold metallo-hydrolase [Chloroflexi bacterium]|nr:MBL fold metallo-hydrolase [Chloroflexota bacterium]